MFCQTWITLVLQKECQHAAQGSEYSLFKYKTNEKLSIQELILSWKITDTFWKLHYTWFKIMCRICSNNPQIYQQKYQDS